MRPGATEEGIETRVPSHPASSLRREDASLAMTVASRMKPAGMLVAVEEDSIIILSGGLEDKLASLVQIQPFTLRPDLYFEARLTSFLNC
jgi:hypothetical protein